MLENSGPFPDPPYSDSQVECGSHCPTCGGTCAVHTNRSRELGLFFDSLAPNDCKLHRCQLSHQWISGKYGDIKLVEPATNKNCLDEIQKIVKEEENKLNPPPLYPILNFSETMSYMPKKKIKQEAKPIIKEEPKPKFDNLYETANDRDITLED